MARRYTALLYERGHWRPDADPWAAIEIRRATADDGPALERLSQLDSAARISGDALIAFADGEPCAAISLVDGRVVADPFRLTGQAVELLRARAEHLRAGEPRRRRFARALRPRRA